jgi:hypothetical protein
VKLGDANTDDPSEDRHRDDDNNGSPCLPELLIGEGKQTRGQASRNGDKCSPPKCGVPPNLEAWRFGRRYIGEHDRNDEPGNHLGAC